MVDGTMAVSSVLYHSENEYYAFLPEYLVRKSINEGIVYKVDIKGVELVKTIYIASSKENEILLDKLLTIKR